MVQHQNIDLCTGGCICFCFIEHVCYGYFDGEENWVKYELWVAKQYFEIQEDNPDLFFNLSD